MLISISWQIEIFSKKTIPLFSQFEKRTIKSRVLVISMMTIRIIAFASICTRSRKHKYLILCVLVDCTRLSEKRIVIVIVPFSFSLLIFFIFFFFFSHSTVLLFPLIIKYIASYCVAKIRTKVGCFSYYHEQIPIRSRLFVTITRIRSRYVFYHVRSINTRQFALSIYWRYTHWYTYHREFFFFQSNQSVPDQILI